MVFCGYENKHLLNLGSEDQLQMACVKYLRTTDVIFSCNGLAECLDTDEKRVKSYQMGYSKGMPDLIIYTPNRSYNMLCIELKTPWGNGEISPAQVKKLDSLERECKAFCCVLNSIEAFVEIVQRYLNDLL